MTPHQHITKTQELVCVYPQTECKNCWWRLTLKLEVARHGIFKGIFKGSTI